jgi:hypothetical protein
MAHRIRNAAVGDRLRRTCGRLAMVAGIAVWAAAGAASAAEVNYTDAFRAKALKCIHPTVNPEKATVEIEKPAETKGELTTVRLKAYYEGFMKKHSMEADLIVRQAGSIRQMKVKVLADTGPAHKPCALEQNWQDF